MLGTEPRSSELPPELDLALSAGEVTENTYVRDEHASHSLTNKSKTTEVLTVKGHTQDSPL